LDQFVFATPQTYLIKTDANGDTLWTRTIGSQGYLAEARRSAGEGRCYIVVGVVKIQPMAISKSIW